MDEHEVARAQMTAHIGQERARASDIISGTLDRIRVSLAEGIDPDMLWAIQLASISENFGCDKEEGPLEVVGMFAEALIRLERVQQERDIARIKLPAHLKEFKRREHADVPQVSHVNLALTKAGLESAHASDDWQGNEDVNGFVVDWDVEAQACRVYSVQEGSPVDEDGDAPIAALKTIEFALGAEYIESRREETFVWAYPEIGEL